MDCVLARLLGRGEIVANLGRDQQGVRHAGKHGELVAGAAPPPGGIIVAASQFSTDDASPSVAMRANRAVRRS